MLALKQLFSRYQEIYMKAIFHEVNTIVNYYIMKHIYPFLLVQVSRSSMFLKNHKLYSLWDIKSGV